MPDAAARGHMVAGLRAHLKAGGHCFLVLPRSCVERSRKLTPARFDDVLARAGLVERERRVTPKLLCLCLEAGAPGPAAPTAAEGGDALRPRRRKGNDFDIVLPGDSSTGPAAAGRRRR